MRKLLKYFLGFLCLLGAFFVPQKSLAQNYAPEKIFYLAKYNAVAGVESVNKNWAQIDILAPQYHVVKSDFTISGAFGPKLRVAIKEHNLKVMPLVSNEGFSQSAMHKLLLSGAGQDLVIAQLLLLAKTQNYIGWQFDFEHINYQDKDLYTALVKRAYKVFQQNNLVLSVAVIARIDDNQTTNAFKNWGGAYDYQQISQNSDFISLMAYDDPNSQGPSASSPYVQNILAYVKDKIPANKLSLGVPLYYWKWNADTSTKIGSGLFKNIIKIVSSYKYVMGFDNNLGVASISYLYGAKNYKIWFENNQSFQAKLQIVKQNNLRGFSAWLLGGEDPAIWTVLSQK